MREQRLAAAIERVEADMNYGELARMWNARSGVESAPRGAGGPHTHRNSAWQRLPVEAVVAKGNRGDEKSHGNDALTSDWVPGYGDCANIA